MNKLLKPQLTLLILLSIISITAYTKNAKDNFLTGTWTGIWEYHIADNSGICYDLKTIILKQIGVNFSGNGIYIAQTPINENCIPSGDFVVLSGHIEGVLITMIWDFGDGVTTQVTGNINTENTIMLLNAQEFNQGQIHNFKKTTLKSVYNLALLR